jgi:hypothetical protein
MKVVNDEVARAKRALDLMEFRQKKVREVLDELVRLGYNTLGLDEGGAYVLHHSEPFPEVLRIEWMAWKRQRHPKTGRVQCSNGIGEVFFVYTAQYGNQWRWGPNHKPEQAGGLTPPEAMRAYCAGLSTFFSDRGEDRPPESA